ncbi:MAG: hypothetical protein ACI9OJ_003998 [Myxococcota bacterium]
MDTLTFINADLQRTLSVFDDLVRTWPGGPWTWDGRFSVPVSIVREPELEHALSVVRTIMPYEFDSQAREHLPDSLASAIAARGGLRSGQLAFCDHINNGSVRFCLWWPWNSGDAVSIRVGIAD